MLAGYSSSKQVENAAGPCRGMIRNQLWMQLLDLATANHARTISTGTLLVWVSDLNGCVQTVFNQKVPFWWMWMDLHPPLYLLCASLRSVFAPSLCMPAVSLGCICWKGVATLWSVCACARVRLFLFLVRAGNATNIMGISYASVGVLI